MTTTHAQTAKLATALADQVVSTVGTSSPQRTSELRRALVQAIAQHVQRAATEQCAIDNTRAPGR